MSLATAATHTPVLATDKKINTTCAYCGVGCGITAHVNEKTRTVDVKGDMHHPANFGKLCSKGSALGETLDLSSRLLAPEVNGKQTDWETALDTVAERFSSIIKEHGPNAVAIYGSGQLLTEDYYVANKLMKGFIGTANIDTNSRLCMASAVVGHKRAFGADTVPNNYDDLHHANLLVIVGSNTAWCHPIIFGRIRAAKEADPQLKIVVIDPRKTNTCDIADLHLPLAIGSDVKLFNGLLHHLHTQDALDHDYINTHTNGIDDALVAAQNDANSIADVAKYCALSEQDVTTFYDWFTRTPKAMTLFSMGVKQSTSGVDKVNSIINCHLATGRVGKQGAGPFSLTGQPNAMGGREVGGLANQLAAHMDFNEGDLDRVARFWQTDNLAQKPGLPAVSLFDEIDKGNVKALWVMATNPVVSLPNADKVKAAIEKCDFVVVSDCVNKGDTLDLAHVKLPAQGWSEKDGMVTNSERRVSRQRRLLPPAGEAKPDWWIMTQVAHKLGFEKSFNYGCSADIFKEHAALSAFENTPTQKRRDFNIGALAHLTDAQYDAFMPTQWPIPHIADTLEENIAYANTHSTHFFTQGGFFTPNQKANFIALTTKKPQNAPSANYPLILNTGRLRDQWHTMTRTALSSRLNQHKSEPFVEVHPNDAKKYNLQAHELATLTTQWGSMVCRVDITTTQQESNIFVPMHWTNQYANKGRMGALVNPAVDALSGQPECKHTPVNITPFAQAVRGFILSREPLDLTCEYIVKISQDTYYRYEVASSSTPKHLKNWLAHKSGANLNPPTQELNDPQAGIYRAANITNNTVNYIVCLANEFTAPKLPDRPYLSSVIAHTQSTELDQKVLQPLLTGIAPIGVEDTGKTVCACFNVGEKTILNTIKKHSLSDYKQVGKHCQAGTNCGSCVPEIKILLAQ